MMSLTFQCDFYKSLGRPSQIVGNSLVLPSMRTTQFAFCYFTWHQSAGVEQYFLLKNVKSRERHDRHYLRVKGEADIYCYI